MLLGFSPLLFTTILFSLATFAAGSLSLRAEATDYRLHVCARKITASREDLHRFLGRTNRAMIPLQATVYAARGLALAPGVGAVASLGEKAALAGLQKLRWIQNAQVRLHRIRELRSRLCAPTKRSRTAAFCHVHPAIHEDAFTRAATLFRDVPGLTRWRPSSLGRVTCRSGTRFFPLEILGPKEPELGGWKHHYGNSP